MIAVRVTDAAVDAAIAVMYPGRGYSEQLPFGTRGHVARILAAAGVHLAVDGLGGLLGRLERATNVSDVEDICQDLRQHLGFPRDEVSPWGKA